MAVHLGTLLLELQLDGAKFHQDLEAARRSAMKAGADIERSLQGSSKLKTPKLDKLKPLVDDSELTALNKHLDLKVKHFTQVSDLFRTKPLRPGVNTEEFKRSQESYRRFAEAANRPVRLRVDATELDRLSARQVQVQLKSQPAYAGSVNEQSSAGSTAVVSKLDEVVTQLRENKKSSSEDSIKISRIIHSSSKDSLLDKVLGTPGRVFDSLTTGFIEGVGTHFSFEFSKGAADYVEKKTGHNFYDVGRGTARFGYGRAKGFGEIGAAALGYRGGLRDVAKDFQYVQQKVDDFLNPRKFVKAIKRFEDTLVSALEDVHVYNKPERARQKIGKYFEPSVDGIREAGMRAAGVGVRAAAQPFRIRKRVQLAQSMELAKQLAEQMQVPDIENAEDIKTIALMTGGVDFQEGGRNTYFARNVLKNVLGKGTATVPVPNAYSNSDELGGLFELRKGIAQLLSKISGQELDEDALQAMPVDRLLNLAVESGYNPDAIKLEATRLAYEKKYPGKNFVFAGTSGGTVAAEEATAIAERGGATNTKGFGATLGLYGLTQTASAKNFQAFVGDQDPLYMASFGTKHIDRSKLSKAQLKILDESLKQLPTPENMMTGLLAPSRNTTIIPGAGVAHHLGQFMADPALQAALVKFLGKSGAPVSKEFQGKEGTAAFKMYADMYAQFESLTRTLGVLKDDPKAIAQMQAGGYSFVTEDKQLRKTYGDSQEKADLEYAAAEFEPSKRIKGTALAEGQAFKKVMTDIIAALSESDRIDVAKIEEAYAALQKIFGEAPRFDNDAVPFHPAQYTHLAAINTSLGGSAVEGELPPFEAKYAGTTDRVMGFTNEEKTKIYKIVKNHLVANLQSMFGVKGMSPVSIEAIEPPPPPIEPASAAAIALPKKQMSEAEVAYRNTARLVRLQQQQPGVVEPSASPDAESLRRIVRDRNIQIKAKVNRLKDLVANGLTDEAEEVGKQIIRGIAEARVMVEAAIEQGLEAPIARAAKAQLTKTENSLKREWQQTGKTENQPRNVTEQIYQQQQSVAASPTFKQRFIAMLAQRRKTGGTGGNEAGMIDPRLLGAGLVADGVQNAAKAARKAMEAANASVVGGLQNIVKAFNPIELIRARQKAQLDRSAQMVLKRAKEIEKTLGSYSDQAKSILVVSGGFAGKKGKTSESVAERVGKLAGSDFITEHVDNIATDTSVAFAKKVPFILQVIGKAFKHNIATAYNPDAIEMAAVGLARHRQTGKPVNFVGYSAGGYVAREAQQILERTGVDSKAAGIGTPLFNLFGSNPEKFKAFLGQGDLLAPFAQRIQSFTGADPSQVMLSQAGNKHLLSNYLGSGDFHSRLFAFLGQRRTSNQPVSPREFEGGGLDPFSGGGAGGSPPPNRPNLLASVGANARALVQAISPQNIAQAARNQAQVYAKAFQEKLKDLGKDLGEFQEFEVRTEHPLENIPIIGGSISFMLDSLEAMKGMATFAPKVGRAFAGIADGILKNSKLITNLAIGFVTFQTVLKPILGLLDQFVSASMEVAMRFESLEQAIKFTTGAQGAMNVQFAKDEAVRTGGDIETGMRGFSGLSASARNTSLEGEGVRDLYSAVSQASAVYAVSPERQQNAFVALQQMIDKNQLSLEELRGQLAEALPSSIGVAARAYGMSPQEFSKRVESGEVRADEFIPRFSQQLAAETSVGVAGSQNTSQAATNRLNNQMLLLQESIGDIALPVRNAGFNLMADAMKIAADNAQILNVALGLVGFAITRNLIQGIAQLVGMLVGIPSVMNLVAAGLAKLPGLLARVATMLKRVAIEFAVISAVVNLVHVFKTGISDSSGVIGQAADNINGRLDKYKQSIGESTDKTNGFIQSLKNMGETLGEVKAKSLMEETLVGGLFKAVLGEEAGAGLSRFIERGAQNSARFVEEKVFGEAMTRTYAQKRAEDNIIQTGSAITGAETTLSQLNSLFGVDGKVGAQIAELQRIDEELRQNSLQRQALDPADTDARRVLGAQRDSLVAAREAANRPIAEVRERVAADIESLKQVRDELAADLESGEFDTEENAGNRAQMVQQLEHVKSLIEAQEKSQGRINSLISQGVSRTQLLRREFEMIKAVSADTNVRLQKEAAIDQTEVLQAEAERGNPNQARLTDQQNNANRRRLEAQIAANQEEISKLQNQLLDSSVQDVLRTAGFNSNTGANEIRAYANDPARPDGELKTELLRAADIREQLLQREIDTATLQGEIAQTQISAQQALRDTSLQVADFYRQIERKSQELAISLKQSGLEIEMMRARTRLTSALTNMSNKYFGEFASGMAELVEQMFKPLQNILEAQQQRLVASNEYQDMLLQSTQLRNGLVPMAGESFSGGAVAAATGGNPSNIRQVATGTLAAQEYGASRSGGTRRHAGQDLDYDVNGRAQSFIGGIVTAIRSDPGGYGNYIDIYNETLGVVERLAEMDQVLVRVGERIGQGQDVGAGTRDTGVIHYEIRTDANAQGIGGSGYNGTVDPINFLEQSGIVRRQGNQLIPIGGGRAVDMNNNVHGLNDGHNHTPQELGLPASVNQPSRPAPAPSTQGLTVKGQQMTPAQLQNARAIVEAGRAAGASQRDIEIAIMTAIQESVLVNLDRGDRDSQGLFQQRPSSWGSLDEIRDPRRSATAFFTGTTAHNGSHTPGLLDLGDRRNQLSRNDAAQAVQRSGHPDAYAQWEGEAQRITAALLSGNSSQAPTQYPGMPGVNEGLRFGEAQVDQGVGLAGQNLAQTYANIDQRLAATNSEAAARLRQMVQERSRILTNSTRQMQDEARTYERAQQDILLETLGDGSFANLVRTQTTNRRAFEDQNRELLRDVEQAQEAIKSAEESRDIVREEVERARSEMTTAGLDPTFIQEYLQPLTQTISDLDTYIANTQEGLNGLQDRLNDAQTVADTQAARLQEQYDLEVQLQREQGVRQSAMLGMQAQLSEAGLARNELGSQAIQTRIDLAGIGDKYTEQLRPLQQELERLQEVITGIDGQTPQLNEEQLAEAQERVDFLTESIGRLEDQQDIEVNIRVNELRGSMTQIEEELAGSTVEAQATFMESRNDTFGASAIRENYAMEQENLRYSRQVAGFDALEASGYLTDEDLQRLQQIRAEAELLNQVNLENIDTQFKDLGETLMDVGKNALGGFFNDILTGSKSAGEAFKDLISNLLSQLAQLAVNALLKDLFGGGGGLFGGGQQQAGGGGLAGVLGGLFNAGSSIAAPATGGGGGFGGGLLGTIFNIGTSLIGGMKEGGEVKALDHSAYHTGYGAISEALKREGSGSVLSALTPGETVLTVEQSRKYKQLGGEEIFNFKKGGTVPGGRNVPKASTGASENRKSGDINVPISVSIDGGGSESDYDIPAFRGVMESQVQEIILREKRPGGTLYPR